MWRYAFRRAFFGLIVLAVASVPLFVGFHCVADNSCPTCGSLQREAPHAQSFAAHPHTPVVPTR